MRIAFHVPRAAYLGEGHSGDQVLVATLLHGLRQRGHRVEVVSGMDARDLPSGRVSVRSLVREALAVRRRVRRLEPDAWFVYMPMANHPDLFSWWLRPPRLVVFAADKGRPEQLPSGWRALFQLAHRRCLRRADVVTVYGPRAARRVRELGVPATRLRTLLPTVEPWSSLPPRRDARRRLDLPDDATVILCVSRQTLTRKDGRPGKTDMIVDLIHSVTALPGEVVLLLVGDGEGRPRVEQAAAKVQPRGRVRVVGAVHLEDLRACFAASDVFAYPYGLDRPWVVLLEAQCCGVSVVTMDTDCGRSIVEPGETGLLARDLEEFAEQLRELVEDRGRRERLGERAAKYVRERHTTEIRLQEIEGLLAG
jgi:glycosyltransferase involved in cell wall biosynthesis